MTPIEFQTDGTAPVALVGLTDDELARLEYLMTQHHDADVGGSALWKKVRAARLDIDRITRELPVAMGGRRDYYEGHW